MPCTHCDEAYTQKKKVLLNTRNTCNGGGREASQWRVAVYLAQSCTVVSSIDVWPPEKSGNTGLPIRPPWISEWWTFMGYSHEPTLSLEDLSPL